MTRDLHGEKDGLWAGTYPPRGVRAPLGGVGVHGSGADLAIVSYGNGYYLARQAMKILAEEHGLATRAIDLRWLAPLAVDSLLEAIEPCRAVLIVDECRITGSQSEGLMALIAERTGRISRRLAAEASFVATGPAAAATLPSVEQIVEAALAAAGRCP